MASIQSTIKLFDGYSPVIRNMIRANQNIISSFGSTEQASGNAFNVEAIKTAQNALAQVEVEFDEVEKNINKASQSQQKFTQDIRSGESASKDLLSTFARLAATIGAAIGVKKMISLSDAMVTTTARLNMMNDGLQTTEELQRKIFESAERSGAAYQSTADMVAKLGTQAKSAFGSNDELIAFSEALNKSFTIAGADGMAVESVMYNLTQALSSGVLRGQDLNAVFSNAPNIIQNIADYLDVPIGKIRDLAAEGELSAEVVKNAMLAAAEDINEQFESIPRTLANIWTSIKNNAIMAFQPILERINQLANSEEFQMFVVNFINALYSIAEVAVVVFEHIVDLVNWTSDNWSNLGPIIMGIVGALGAWAVAQMILNAVSDANPTIMMISAIGAAIGWVASLVGGFGALWQYIWTGIQTGVKYAAFGIMTAIYWIMGVLETLGAIALDVWDALVTGLDLAFSSILIILEGIVNAVISALNAIIDAINTAFGWLWGNIGKIELATFGSNAMASAESAAKARGAESDARWADVEANRADRDATLNNMLLDAQTTWNDGIAEAGRMADASTNQVGETMPDLTAGFEWDGLTASVDDIAGNTAKSAKSLEYAEEDLRYLRDIAERDAINRFTTAEIHIEQRNENHISSMLDLDGVVGKLNEGIEEMVVVASEGGHQ